MGSCKSSINSETQIREYKNKPKFKIIPSVESLEIPNLQSDGEVFDKLGKQYFYKVNFIFYIWKISKMLNIIYVKRLLYNQRIFLLTFI
jgi:hypothetical protein